MTIWVIKRMSRERRRSRTYSSSCIFVRLTLDELTPRRVVDCVGDREDVLVPPTGLIDDNHVFAAELPGFLEGLRESMRRLEGRNEPLAANGERHRVHRFGVGRGFEAGASGLLQMREDRRYPDVVEPRGNAVRIEHLPVVVLQEVGPIALRDSYRGVGAGEPAGVLSGVEPATAGFHPPQSPPRIVEEPAENPHRVGATADARVNPSRELPFDFEDLPSGFLADDRLKPRHHF